MKLTELEHATLLTALQVAVDFYARGIKFDAVIGVNAGSRKIYESHLKRTQELHALLLNADYIEVIAL